MTSCKMFLSLLLSAVMIEGFPFSSTKSEQDDSILGHYYSKKSLNTESVRETARKLRQNYTFIDTPDNSMHVPFFEEPKSTKKIRKSPKRTIQKIIKKSRSKRKFFLNMMTSTTVPSVEPPHFEVDFTQINVVPPETTPQTLTKKKPRYSGRLARYPASYQRTSYGSFRQHIDNFKRNKREEERDVYIIKDLDEVKFLPKQDGYDSAIVHVKKYW